MEFTIRRPNKHHQQKPQMGCKKHPKHQQSPGVCSICLTEKLLKLSKNSSRNYIRSRSVVIDSSCSSSSLSSLSSSHYSASGSSCSSPAHRLHYRGPGSDGRGGFSMAFFKAGKSALTKSRSMAFITRKREAEATGGQAGIDDHGKKKSSFWSKLMHPRNKRIDHEGLAHSTARIARVATKPH